MTLIELMIGMAIIGILSAVVYYSLSRSLPEKHLKQAATQLYLDMQKAKSLAVLNRQRMRIDFNPVTQSYSMVDDQADTTLKTVSLSNYKSGITYGSGPASRPYGTASTFGDDYITYDPDNSIVFEPNGMANAGTVYLTNINKSVCYALRTPMSTGNIKIIKTGSETWPDE